MVYQRTIFRVVIMLFYQIFSDFISRYKHLLTSCSYAEPNGCIVLSIIYFSFQVLKKFDKKFVKFTFKVL